MTVVNKMNLVNGQGTKSVTVLEGNKVISEQSEKLNLRETRSVHKRKYMKGFYRTLHKRTRRHLRSKSKAHLFF